MTNNPQEIIEFDKRWEFLQKGITKLINILEGLPEPQFTADEKMTLYGTIYDMCCQRHPTEGHRKRLYKKYRESFDEYFTSTVVPCLSEKDGEVLLRELVKRWSNNKIMGHKLSRIFHYLDRFYLPRWDLPLCEEVGHIRFRQLVYENIKGKVRDAVISMINREREGEQIDRVLLKNVVDIFVEVGKTWEMKYYENDFEEAMLKDTVAYYSHKASTWILKYSCADYMLKAHECLRREKERVSHYLHPSSETKLLEKVQHELLSVVSAYSAQLLEKMHLDDSSDDMVDDFLFI